MHLSKILLLFFLSINLLFAEKKPNIGLFMADDFGHASTNAMGASESFVKTPHLNRLVEEGMNFTNAFASTSVCTPTRYAMLTGQYSWRTKLKSGVINSCDPLLISRDTVTIGKYLQNIGYRTAAVGKWHLGYKEKRFENLLGKITPGPNNIGFDYHFGVPNNLDDIHKVYIENDHIFELKSDKIQSYGKSYYNKPYTGYDAPQSQCDQVMDFTTQKAINWMTDESQK